MPVSQTLSPVIFHGDTIFVVDHQGEPFAPVKPIVENMGLDRKAQQRKLANNQSRWGGVMIALPSASGVQKTLCIPVRKLAGFLATISPKKVREELRPKVIQYQNECDDALWNYWTKGSAKRPESPASQPSQPDLPGTDQKPPQLSQSERDLLATIKRLDSQNRELADSMKTVNASYVGLLERHTCLLEAYFKANAKAISADYEYQLEALQNQLKFFLGRR